MGVARAWDYHPSKQWIHSVNFVNQVGFQRDMLVTDSIRWSQDTETWRFQGPPDIQIDDDFWRFGVLTLVYHLILQVQQVCSMSPSAPSTNAQGHQGFRRALEMRRGCDQKESSSCDSKASVCGSILNILAVLRQRQAQSGKGYGGSDVIGSLSGIVGTLTIPFTPGIIQCVCQLYSEPFWHACQRHFRACPSAWRFFHSQSMSYHHHSVRAWAICASLPKIESSDGCGYNWSQENPEIVSINMTWAGACRCDVGY